MPDIFCESIQPGKKMIHIENTGQTGFSGYGIHRNLNYLKTLLPSLH